MMENQPTEGVKKKPKWLKILEKQSWQAELVVSGLAIFGSLQFPSAINDWVDTVIYIVPEQLMVITKFFFLYLFMVSTILIVNFILHFVLRALWIGMLGLVSVFPNGINYNFKTYSDDYNQKIKKEFPDINQFNLKLDRLCSIIFSISSLGVMIFLSFSILVLGVGLLAWGVNLLLPQYSYDRIFPILFFIAVFPGLFQSVFLLKGLKEKAWVKKIHFPIFKGFTKVAYNICYEAIHYIQLTLVTNSSMTKSSVFFTIYFSLIGFITGFSLISSNVNLLEFKGYEKYQNSSTSWNASQYEETLPEGKRIFGAMIQAYQIEEDEISLFVPRFAREKTAVDSICFEKWSYNDNLSEADNERSKLANRQNCHNNYYQVMLNDSLIRDLRFYNYRHPNKNERGYLTHISTSNCKKGNNELKIILGYKNPKTNKNKQFRIPFRYH